MPSTFFDLASATAITPGHRPQRHLESQPTAAKAYKFTANRRQYAYYFNAQTLYQQSAELASARSVRQPGV